MQQNLVKAINDINHFIFATNTNNNMATSKLADDIIRSAGPNKNPRVHYNRLADGTQTTSETNQKWASKIINTIQENRPDIPQTRPIPWASCQIRKIAGAHAPGMPGTFSPSPQVSDPDMHHGTCVTHVPWCMPGSLTSGFLWNRQWGKTFPAFLAHAQPAILRIW